MIEIVLTADDSWFSRLARWLGAEWTHAMLRFECPGYNGCDICKTQTWLATEMDWVDPTHLAATKLKPMLQYHVIEATMRHGVIERPWNPEEYKRWAVYRVADWFWANPQQKTGSEERVLAYARGNIGKFYAFDRLALVLPKLLRQAIANIVRPPTDVASRLDADIAWMLSGERRHICTSLVDDSFLYGDVDLRPDIDTPWLLPDDFRDSPLLELAPPDGAIEW